MLLVDIRPIDDKLVYRLEISGMRSSNYTTDPREPVRSWERRYRGVLLNGRESDRRYHGAGDWLEPGTSTQALVGSHQPRREVLGGGIQKTSGDNQNEHTKKNQRFIIGRQGNGKVRIKVRMWS